MKDIGKQTRAKIIQVIEELVNEKSLDKISIREICQKANIAVGTFYIYFASKEEAFLHVYHQLDEQFKSLKLDQTPLDNVALILTTYYNMVDIEPLRVYRTLYSYHLNHYDDYYFDENRAVFIVLFNEIVKIVHDEVKAKKLTWLVLDFCRGRIFNYLIKYEEDIVEWIDEQIILTLDYLHFLIERRLK